MDKLLILTLALVFVACGGNKSGKQKYSLREIDSIISESLSSTDSVLRDNGVKTVIVGSMSESAPRTGGASSASDDIYKEPTDGKTSAEDGMVGFDRMEDIDDDDDIRSYMEDYD